MILPELIKTGPGPRSAFIETPQSDDIAETLISFANTEGGTIVIGVDENGKPAANGNIDNEKLEATLKAAEELCNPTVVVGNWEEYAIEGGKVYALRVPRSIELHALTDGRVLIRSGTKNRPLGGQEILRLASTKNTGDFESDILPGATKDDFSRKVLDEYLEKRAERTKRPYDGKLDDLLKEIGALNADGNPTVSGILMFSEYPQQWLPQSSVVFAKFVGKTPRGESGLAGYSRREELTGPLPRLIESAWNLIWSEMAVSAVVKGLELWIARHEAARVRIARKRIRRHESFALWVSRDVFDDIFHGGPFRLDAPGPGRAAIDSGIKEARP